MALSPGWKLAASPEIICCLTLKRQMPPESGGMVGNDSMASRISLPSLFLAPPGGAVPIIGMGEKHGAFEHAVNAANDGRRRQVIVSQALTAIKTKKPGFPTENPA
ncbi:hypothetical protein ACPRNU_21710 [Chromobacterium vaccinii]|uniref:hypothetical protein n=1 Tax=Chromobacterium vaccinii TaxID=1108595 RepID=UPI003C7508AD